VNHRSPGDALAATIVCVLLGAATQVDDPVARLEAVHADAQARGTRPPELTSTALMSVPRPVVERAAPLPRRATSSGVTHRRAV
jgi:hypothetical protein